MFTRSSAGQLQNQLIETINQDQTPTLTQSITSGSVRDLPGYTISIGYSTSANTSLILNETITSAIIDYRIQRSDNYRIGTMKVSHYNGAVVYEDDYSESANIQVSLSWGANATTATLYATAGAYSNINAYMKYTIRSFV